LEDNLPINIIFISILLVLSAFFSGSESAFYSIDYITREKLRKEDKKSKIIYNLLQHPNKLLITILIGNMFVNILASSLVSGFAITLTSQVGISNILGVSIAITIMSILIILFGEIMPKIIAISKPITFARIFAIPINIVIILLRPVSIIFQYFTDIITNKIIKYSSETMKEEDINSIIKIGHKHGIIDEEEKNIMENVFSSVKKEVSEIMIPRTKLFALNIEKGEKYIIKSIIKNKYSRVVIFKEIRDNIIGIIRKKDILPYYFNLKKANTLKDIIKPVIFVPENKKINDMLREFQKEKKDFAIVVDEYGGTLGGLTIDDIVEEIMGEYQTDYEQENVHLKKIGKDKYIINGDMEIEEFNEIFNASIESEDSDTISGLIMEHTEKIPQTGEKIIIDHFDFTVNKTRGPKILRLMVEVREG